MVERGAGNKLLKDLQHDRCTQLRLVAAMPEGKQGLSKSCKASVAALWCAEWHCTLGVNVGSTFKSKPGSCQSARQWVHFQYQTGKL